MAGSGPVRPRRAGAGVTMTAPRAAFPAAVLASCLLAGCAGVPDAAPEPTRGAYFSSLAELRQSHNGTSSGVEALQPLASTMDLATARKLAWDGPVGFWVVDGEEGVCLVAEMAVPADEPLDGGRVSEPVSLGAGSTLAPGCTSIPEFEAGGLTLDAASSVTKVTVKLLPDGRLPEGDRWPQIAPNLFGTVSDLP